MLVSFREPIGAVTTTEMKPLGRKTNSLIRTARAAALREKTTRKKRLTDRARTFRKSGLDVQKNMRRPAAGAFFYLTSPFIGHVTRMTFRRRGVLATDTSSLRFTDRGDPAMTWAQRAEAGVDAKHFQAALAAATDTL